LYKTGIAKGSVEELSSRSIIDGKTFKETTRARFSSIHD
jgi:hypothetical protein